MALSETEIPGKMRIFPCPIPHIPDQPNKKTAPDLNPMPQ